MSALLLSALPAILLFLALLRGVYPGAVLIDRMRRGLKRPRRRPAVSPPVQTRGRRRSRRSGELLSAGLAGRAPPSGPGRRHPAPRPGRRNVREIKENQMKKIAIASLALGLVAPAVAQGHVTLQPDEVPADGYTRLDVRVPNERDDSGTVKVEVQFPDGFYSASYEPVPGWEVRVRRERLPEPVEGPHGEEVTEQIDRIVWTGDGRQGIVPPGAFQDFGLSLRTPDTAGEELTFRSLQTYESGEVVRWIGPPDADEPAPTVSLTEPEATHEGDGEDEETAAEPTDEDDGDGNGLAIAGLVVGGLGLGAGGTALARSRRSA